MHYAPSSSLVCFSTKQNTQVYDPATSYNAHDKIKACGVQCKYKDIGVLRSRSAFRVHDDLFNKNPNLRKEISQLLRPFYNIEEARIACLHVFDNKFSLILDDNVEGTSLHGMRKNIRCKHHRNCQCQQSCKCLFRLV